MNDADDEPDARTVAALADTARLTGQPCAGCGVPLCGHAAVFALVLGYKNAPRCLPCTAAHMRDDTVALRERTLAWVQHHDCFHTAWRHAGERESSADRVRPACVFGDSTHATTPPAQAPAAEPAPGASDVPVAVWNAGPMGCGDLVLELRTRLAALPPGAVFELRAEDPGAPIDLPAWCKLTGHSMVAVAHPTYRIRRKP